ncbi:hypothetical protein ASA1KI_09530 [Opitutales bacterium ASA1]|uniref:tetratricopeptide repeat protein n=1 Tax=Congregicoccus parvus TaxID=3081749 RepID=UPI002B30077C|nr:hypothetical protein ASA1KI_09530 [Opitutales bacterium ASA1]
MSPFLLPSFVVERLINTSATRIALRGCAVVVLTLIFLGSIAQAASSVQESHEDVEAVTHATVEDHAAHPIEASVEPAAVGDAEVHVQTEGRHEVLERLLPEPVNPLKKIAFFHEAGMRAWRIGDRARAEEAFAAALAVNTPPETKKALMLEMGRLYREAGDRMQAIAVLEKFAQLLPADAEVPGVLLELGVLYRETGALDTAIARFFLVLNSTLRVAPDQFERYRKLSMKARLEIAETHSLRGEHDEARKYYARLEVLDLEGADRERVYFRGAQLQYSLEQWFEAEKRLAAFLGEYPGSGHAPEARYLRAKALERLDRRQEAVQEVLALLRTSEEDVADDGGTLAYWKRRTGNELANRFYEQGDVPGALAIYQALARASEDPSWRWPAVYQIGLCFERLNLPERAIEAYKVIVAPAGEGDVPEHLPESLRAVREMAQWRLRHLDWVEQFAKGLQEFPAVSAES